MKLLFLFSYNISLKDWDNLGILSREIAIYKKIYEQGTHITFLTYGDDRDLHYKQVLNGINIFPISPHVKSKFNIGRYVKSFLLPIKLKHLFANIDLIKTNQLSGSWTAWLAKLLYRKKLIIRGGYEYLRNYIDLSKVKGNGSLSIFYLNYIYIYFLELISYKLADAIFLTSISDIDFILKKFKFKAKTKRIYLMSNYVITNLFKPTILKKKDKHVLFIGRLIPAKNLLNLILALRDLKVYTLDIIGEGPMLKELQEKARVYNVRVNFMGIYPNEKLPSIINRYNLFVIPSYYEGNPKALLEAMSCGLACIGTNVRGINNIIQNKKNGFLCETNATSIAKTIKYVDEHKDIRENVGKMARNFVIENYSLRKSVEKEIAIYKKLLRSK